MKSTDFSSISYNSHFGFPCPPKKTTFFQKKINQRKQQNSASVDRALEVQWATYHALYRRKLINWKGRRLSQFYIFTFYGVFGSERNFFYYHWKDLRMQPSYGELRVPLRSETIWMFLMCLSGFFYVALDSELVANTLKKTKCRLFIVSPRFWHKFWDGPYKMHRCLLYTSPSPRD